MKPSFLHAIFDNGLACMPALEASLNEPFDCCDVDPVSTGHLEGGIWNGSWIDNRALGEGTAETVHG